LANRNLVHNLSQNSSEIRRLDENSTMNKILTLSLAACIAAAATAQSPQTLIFTGRFDFIGADIANERAGGPINALSDLALNAFTPGSWTSAVSAQPATTHHAWMGDAYGDGNYSRFDGFKTYFERWNFAGPFIKDADKSSGDITKVYWTVRDNGVNKNFTVLTGGGTGTATIQPGDFFRWTASGDVEYFITQAQFAIAQGPIPPQGSGADGASAICQDSQGNIYYSPAEGGHWVSGNNQGGPIFAYDGAICMIPATAITYDANGNVASVLPDSAKLLINEIGSGTAGGPNVRDLVQRAACNDYNGNPLGNTANMVGLEIDPNGGTVTASIATGIPPNETYDVVPNMIFTFDSGSWVSTIISTADTSGFGPGSVATINGVACGETTPATIPDPTAWLGTILDAANFTPTTMGIALMSNMAQPLVADMPNKGALTQALPTWEIDFKGPPLTAVFMLSQPGPSAISQFATAFPLAGLPIPPSVLAPGSYSHAFVWPGPDTTALLVTDANGYATFSSGNPWSTAFLGLTLEVQGVGLLPNRVQVSNPVQVHVK